MLLETEDTSRLALRDDRVTLLAEDLGLEMSLSFLIKVYIVNTLCVLILKINYYNSLN